MDRIEARANNINVLPSCDGCVAMGQGAKDCQRLINQGLCRLKMWRQWRGMGSATQKGTKKAPE